MQSEPSSGINLTAYSCICWLFHRIEFDTVLLHNYWATRTVQVSHIGRGKEYFSFQTIHTVCGKQVTFPFNGYSCPIAEIKRVESEVNHSLEFRAEIQNNWISIVLFLHGVRVACQLRHAHIYQRDLYWKDFSKSDNNGGFIRTPFEKTQVSLKGDKLCGNLHEQFPVTYAP